MNKALVKAEASAGERQRGIDRVVDLFEELLRARAPLKVGDLARRLGAPRSSLYNLVNILVDAGILETASEDGAVFFGTAMHLYGAAYVENNPWQKRVRDVLDRLALDHDATAQFCALRGDKYVVLDSRGGTGLFRITADIGVQVPLPWTASGRLLLDHLGPDEITALVPPGDYRLPDGRSVSPEVFLDDVARARRDGCCMTTGLSDPFTSCLAAPIRDAAHRAVSTLCFVVPADTPEERKAHLMTALVEASTALASTLALRR